MMLLDPLASYVKCVIVCASNNKNIRLKTLSRSPAIRTWLHCLHCVKWISVLIIRKAGGTKSEFNYSHQCHKHRWLRWIFITARCSIVQSERGLAIACRLSVRPSVTLVYQDHIGWQSRKLTTLTISRTPPLFVAQRPSAYSQGNMGKLWGD